MAEGFRLQLVLPHAVGAALKQRAAAEGRTASNLGAFIVEAGLRHLLPLGPNPAAGEDE